MKCLITGASGFLGKRVLQLLLEDSRIEQVHVVSRRKKTHPHPKVKIQSADLVAPWGCDGYFEELDAIIHLSGLYEFDLPFTQNYQQNVLTSLNLINKVRQLKSDKKPQILFASTYAVGLGSKSAIPEAPLTHLPPVQESYSYTKALGERALADSGLAARIFRLGVLVGDSKRGEFEKFDGPYYMMRFLNRFSQMGISQMVKRIPIPLVRSGMIPVVPVDAAAKVFHDALFMDRLSPNEQEFYGVFHSNSIQLEYLCRQVFRNFVPHCEPAFSSHIPRWILKAQTCLTGIPSEAFNYSLKPIPLDNPRFRAVFGAHAIPHFQEYEEAFFNGFRKCMATKEINLGNFVKES